MKNLKTLYILTKYSLISTFRNPTAVFFGFFFPFIFILIFGLIGSGSNTYEIAVPDQSSQNNILFEALEKTDVIKLNREITTEEIEDQLKKGQLAASISVTEDVVDPNNPALTSFYVNLQTSAADPQDSTTIKLILENVIKEFNNAALPANQFKLVNLNTEVVEGRKYSQIDFILPGQLSFSLLSTGVMGIAFALITLRKTLVLKRMYATPTPKWVILLSKALSSIVMGILQALLIILVGHYFFEFTLVNGAYTVFLMVLLSVLGLLTFMGLGLIVASVADSEEAASPIANLVTLPQFLLGGSFFPTEVFPAFLQPIAQIMPMTFLNDAMRAVAFEGADLAMILPKILGLVVWGIVTYVVAIKLFKWE